MSEVFQPEAVVNGRYRVIRKIGGGGMADVYLCEDLTLGRHVAIKVLLPRLLADPTFVERFRREAKAAAGLNHANLVSIYDWGELDGAYFIVMEYVEGETLKDLIRRQERLSGNEAVRITLHLLNGLASAHRRGIVHRDIKPQNVMLDREGNVKITDFGIARAADSGMTEVGAVLGTARYLAPEQAKGLQVDPRSDLYSVGIVLYEMLTGTVPFKGDTAVTVALKHVNEMPLEPSELVPGMPSALNQIVLKAIAKNPDDRYQSAEEFARDVRAAQTGGPITAAVFDADVERTRLMRSPAEAIGVVPPPAQTADGGGRGPGRRAWPVILLVIILLLAIAGAAYGIFSVVGSGDPVPSVVGETRDAAIAALQEAGFEPVVTAEEFSDEYAEGEVVRQAPSGGTELRDGGKVELWVSKGSESVAMVNFKGWAPAEVRAWLAENELSGVEKSGRSDAVDKGHVYKQDPAAGQKAKRGSSVTYWVSSGEPQATVPDLSGMTQAQATAALTEQKLKLGSVSLETSTAVAAGLVIRQDPPSGTKVARESAVNVVVSSGSPTPTATPTPTPSSSASEAADLGTVPNVYSMDASTATARLESSGFSVAIRRKASNQPPGTVIAVVPGVGESAPLGSRVLLVVAT